MTISSHSVVIVGAGQAGGDAAAALRQNGYDDDIVVIGAEASMPYSRPPLSKAFIRGEIAANDVLLRDENFYAREGIVLRTGTQVTSIDQHRCTIELSDGEQINYSDLVLATGGEPRRLPRSELTGASNVLTLRTLDDADALRRRLKPGARAVLIGGGYIGLEIASAARQIGADVTVLDIAPRILSRVTGPIVSSFYQRVHREEGTKIVVDAEISTIHCDTNGDVVAVGLGDGLRLESDFLLLGVGIAPRTELAKKAGVAVNDGVLVDTEMRTSSARIYAIGDIARHPCPQHGRLRRIESVPNASEQARCVAAAIMGKPVENRAIPWFWSDQYDVRLQSVGFADDCDHLVVRGNPDLGRRFTLFYLRGQCVIAADVINGPAEFAFARRFIRSATRVDPEMLANPEIPLKSVGVR